MRFEGGYMKKVGVITIGQSPRVDLVPEITKYIDEDIQLDEYTYEEAKKKFKPVSGENVLVSRMRDGKQIEMREDLVNEGIQKYIYNVENDGIYTILLLCTGKFPQFQHQNLLIKPFSLIHSIVKSIVGEEKVGIIVPDTSQTSQCKKWWGNSGMNVVIKSASPYKNIDGEMERVALKLKDECVSMIVMDCMGYSIQMKKRVQEISDIPVILSRALVARVLNEIL
jgi:protein AroM